MPTHPLQLIMSDLRPELRRYQNARWGMAHSVRQKTTVHHLQVAPGQCAVQVGSAQAAPGIVEEGGACLHGQPAAFLTMVPPQRLVAYDQVADINLENEKRAMRRVLRNTLSKATVLVGILDISLAARQSGNFPNRSFARKREPLWGQMRRRSGGPGCRAAASPPTPSASSCTRSPTTSAPSCGRWRCPRGWSGGR